MHSFWFNSSGAGIPQERNAQNMQTNMKACRNKQHLEDSKNFFQTANSGSNLDTTQHKCAVCELNSAFILENAHYDCSMLNDFVTPGTQ